MPELKSKKLLVYDVLKQRIITQAMKPGEPISEGVLSQELDISTTPIREAIQQLEREGFIENIPGKGNFVSDISIQDLRELFEIREMLECEAIKRAATKCDPQKLTEIRRAFELSRESSQNGSHREFRAGEHIHIFIFESLGNQRLLEIYRRLHDHGVKLQVRSSPSDTPHEFLASLDQRLKAVLPAAANPFILRRLEENLQKLVDLYARSVYSPHPPGDGEKTNALEIWRTLQPSIWRLRLRRIFGLIRVGENRRTSKR